MFLDACTHKMPGLQAGARSVLSGSTISPTAVAECIVVNNQSNLCFSCARRSLFPHLSPLFPIPSSPKLYSIKREEIVYVGVSPNLMGARFPTCHSATLKPKQLV